MPYADNEGTKLYWEERGSGEPLLLIMGLGYTLDMWHRILPALAEHYRVIAFDNRGVGRSDVPPGPYTM
ncbi:MAG TPA: alpha/beta fold hydrolase, partial [Blastocatellia bacterium]